MTDGLSKVERQAMELARDPVLVKMLADERIESEDLDFTLFAKLMRFIRPHWLLAAGTTVLLVIESLVMTLPAWVVGLAVDDFVSGGHERTDRLFDVIMSSGAQSFMQFFGTQGDRSGYLIYFGVLLFLLSFLRWGLSVGNAWLVQKLGERVIHDLRCEVYEHITSQGIDYFHRHPVGRLVNRTTFDTQALSELFSNVLAQGLRDVLFLVVLIFVMFSLDTTLAALLVGSFPFLIAVALLYRMIARPAMRTMTAVQSRMNSWLAENLAGMKENQLYRREDVRNLEYRGLTDAHQASITTVIRAWAFLRPGMMVICAIATALVLIIGYEKVLAATVTIGVLVTFLQYTSRIWVPVRSLAEKFNVIQSALTAGERIFEVLETPLTMVDTDSVNPELKVEQGSVVFEGVRFSYPTTTEDVLRGIDFEAAPGQMVALVGDTGAGKSTIIHLISRFYDVSDGRVLVSGHDVRDYTLRNLRLGIALIPQDVVIFAGSLRENIALGADVSDEAIMDTLRAVRLEGLVDRFDKGLDEDMQEGGRTLSAGERQLLSFARAVITRPPILVLDEATASIDTNTEVAIQQAMEELTRGRTTFVIAHRLSTIRNADQILVIRNGEIIERGHHEALLERDGVYAAMYRSHVDG